MINNLCAIMAAPSEEKKNGKTTTNQLIFLRDTVLVKLKKHKCAEPFLAAPVEAAHPGLEPDARVVPMDLVTVEDRLARGHYQCADRCLEDIDLVFDNCLRFYNSDTEQWRCAKQLEQFYLHVLKGMPLQEVEVEDV